MAKKKSLIVIIQELIDKGANTAEDIHKAIADMPLKMLEKIDAISRPMKKISKVQDESIGAIYDLIRDINEQVAKYATEMLAQAREAGIGRGEAPAKKKSAAKKKPAAKAAGKRAARKAS